MSDDKLVEAIARAIWVSSDAYLDNFAGSVAEDCRFQARAALSAIESHGYRVVPVEPSEEMKDAGGGEMATVWASDENPFSMADSVWTAMLSACPKV